MTNPKDRIGVTKVPLGIFPPAALAHTAVAMHDGASKYGRWNWRGEKVAVSVYIDACVRHILDWYHGEEEASDSGAHHLGHAIACLAIILDAQETANLIDDRPAVDQEMSALFEKLSAKIKRINELREPAQNVTRDQAVYLGIDLACEEGSHSVQVKGCCAPSIFSSLGVPPEVINGDKEGALADHKASEAQLERDPRITKTECLLGHEVATIDEKTGYIDGEYLQGTAFKVPVARWRRGFQTIDDEMEAQYAKAKSDDDWK